ncbi:MULTISPECIES: FAD-dependent oxidoreductase [unclassified Cellvibrio]|uniref:FAD-dependent oxidoreductase n=1 Tax=unclassified Cellvibrio TaxID=2624793 RepID=UPI001243EB2F|nr:MULTISPECIES: FAD-dependent oxidoreductase [unclassified Cellvibrio]QEY14916.1 FAD-dependent oxidoreductase [Cellvibrio sp. KY-GH-1]UUA73808.1 FAD-dependent oxidoreductase [Cellvibrio sp. QJXJ]
MITTPFSSTSRLNKEIVINTDLVIAGGGLAGVCAAITAARAGSRVVLVQDRPVLGGNASSEVRLWALGATSHMGNNNRWSREGGVIDEIMLDNLKQNQLGNALIFDSILLNKVAAEANITLLLNTAVFQVNKTLATQIDSVLAFCSQNSTQYHINAPLFCDASGDGILAFNAGASFRMGAESCEEFGELMAPKNESTDLLGHSLFFYSKKLDRPVVFTKPDFAYSHEEIAAIPRCKNINGNDSGCKFWWLEFGGVLDTIYQSEDIKWELWKIVYGIWDYIKNSGKFEDVENLTLEWVGTIPGKRESRRFEGHYMLKQQDIVTQHIFDDAVSYGGWAIDLHPAEGIYSDKPACSQFHSKGVYQIPYRCFVSRDIDNLFLAGRIISASHMAFGSTRVMITCAHGGQAVGEAAAFCRELNCKPAALLAPKHMQELQQRLNLNGQSIPLIPITPSLLMQNAKIKASSTFELNNLPANGDFKTLDQSLAQLLPLNAGPVPKINIDVRAQMESILICELRISSKIGNYTPDILVERIELSLAPGEQNINIQFMAELSQQQYGFLCFMRNDTASLALTDQRITGLCTLLNKIHKAVSNTGRQDPPKNSGLDSFEFWTPERRPNGHNLALHLSPALKPYSAEHLRGGFIRPYLGTNAWVAKLEDKNPNIELSWSDNVKITGLKLFFDTDADHALETVLMEHPETQMPCCVQTIRVLNAYGEELYACAGNYQSIKIIHFNPPLLSNCLNIELSHTEAGAPASLFAIEIL